MPVQEENLEPNQVLPRPAPAEFKVLLKWMAPSRPFKKRDREYYTTIGAIVFLLVVILLFLKEWLLIAVIVAITFVSYVLAAVPPDLVEHEINTRGIILAGKLFAWDNLLRFWWVKKWGQDLLMIEVKKGFPTRLSLMIGEQDKKQITEVMSRYLSQERPSEGWVDGAAKWLAKKFPLESE